jgi:Flp pilus assembly protein TadG
VEFAFTAPIFFLFIFGCVEFARVHMIQAAIENAAFEGARRGIIPGATSANCEASTSTLLNYAGLQDATITVSPTVIDVTTEEVSVTVDVPMTVENGIGLTGYLTGKTLSRTITLPREQ